MNKKLVGLLAVVATVFLASGLLVSQAGTPAVSAKVKNKHVQIDLIVKYLKGSLLPEP